MTATIRCPHCKKYFAAPDLESVKTYAAAGGLIQTLTERIVLQPVHKHYVTPGPFWKAVACAGVPLGFSGMFIKYLNIDPNIVFGSVGLCFCVALVIASTQIEEIEIEDKPANEDDEPESAPQTGPAPLIEVGRPFKNSMTIRWTHEPPSSPDPVRQLNLGKADLALARLATGDNPISPISFAEAKKRGFRAGEPTFYEIQRHWIDEGKAFRSMDGRVYLRESGRRTLARYAQQET